MDKEFEALVVKPIKDTTLDCMNDLISDLENYEQWFDNEEYCKEELQWIKCWSERVKEDLLELQAIKEAKPSEALARVANNLYYHYPEISEDFNILKQALLKAQEDKVIADFIREHYKLSNDINKNYLELKKPITEEESNKFKENL